MLEIIQFHIKQTFKYRYINSKYVTKATLRDDDWPVFILVEYP